MNVHSENFAIMGGGFGLYGYLPAICNICSGRVFLPSRYREIIVSRPELNQFEHRIEWMPSKLRALQECTGVVIALPPQFQAQMLSDIAEFDNIKKIILEKPVAPTAKTAINLFDRNYLESKQVRVAYLFIQLDWYVLLKRALSQSFSDIRITWKFAANHITNNKETWKRYHSQGGGPLRFYGIHLIAVLASLGYKFVSNSILSGQFEDQPTSWHSQFRGEQVPECEITIATNSPAEEFSIMAIDRTGRQCDVYSAHSPFSHGLEDGQDNRVPILMELITSFKNQNTQYYDLYKNTLGLWQEVEALCATNSNVSINIDDV